MNLMKCPNGHHYDASRFSSCPFCGMEGVNVGPDQTTVPLDVPVSQPGPSVATEPLSTAIPDDDDRTLPVTADMLDGATEKSAPVVGWLVCTEGVNKGTDYILAFNAYLKIVPGFELSVSHVVVFHSHKSCFAVRL